MTKVELMKLVMNYGSVKYELGYDMAAGSYGPQHDKNAFDEGFLLEEITEAIRSQFLDPDDI